MQEKEENEKRTGLDYRRILWFVKTALGICLIMAAVYILLSPDVSDISTQKEARKVREKGFEDGKNPEKTVPALERIISYNNSLNGLHQKGLIESYTKTDVWEETYVFGTIQIPDIDVDMPLYVGTTDDNLAMGAAVLEGTSLPVGGKNTNSVISGHRGWKGAAYLKEIEGVSWGDEIIITNPWGTIEYTVVDMDIIEPNESEPLLIHDGKDMLTIVTCHPYRAPRNLRYVVYAERVNTPATDESFENNQKLPEGMNGKQTVSPAYEIERQRLLTVYGSSSEEIRIEKMLRQGTVMLLFILFLFFCIRGGWSYYRRKQYNKPKGKY